MANSVEAIGFRSRDHELLRSYHGDICDVLSRSEETLIMFAGVMCGKRIIDVRTMNAVKNGGEGSDILMDRVEMKVKQNPRHLKRVLRVMKNLKNPRLESISRKIGSKISGSQRRRSQPLLSSDKSYEEENSSLASPGEGECCV